MGKLIDLTGQTFGRLTVIEKTQPPKTVTTKSERKRAYWLCQCTCGNQCIISGKHLREQRTQSCGCLQKEIVSRLNQKDLTGQIFNRLTVISKNCSRQGKVYWNCKCSCGNTTVVPTNSLTQGKTQSCGCLQKEQQSKANLVDLVGQRFNKLLVLKRDTTKNYNRKAYWICQCDCGNIVSVLGTSLHSGNTQSCGCVKTSIGESNIIKLLEDNNIDYRQQFSFNDCLSPKGYLLRFDFAIFDKGILKCLIEFDGPQHEKSSSFFGGEDALNYLKQCDQIKNKYCKGHNIPLIRIPYSKRDNLTINDLI